MSLPTASDFRFRAATLEDLSEILRLVHDVGSDVYAAVGDAGEIEEWIADRGGHGIWAERIIRDDFVVIVGGTALPGGALTVMGYVQDRGEAAYYGGFYCRCRGVGHGRAVYAALQERARPWKCPSDECDIWEALTINRAMVERRGFAEIGEHFDRNIRRARIVEYRRNA